MYSEAIVCVSRVRNCNRTTHGRATTLIIMTTFLKRKFPDSNFALQYLRSRRTRREK